MSQISKLCVRKQGKCEGIKSLVILRRIVSLSSLDVYLCCFSSDPFKKLRPCSKGFFIWGTLASSHRTTRSKNGMSTDRSSAPRARKSQPCRMGSTSPGNPRKINMIPREIRTRRRIKRSFTHPGNRRQFLGFRIGRSVSGLGLTLAPTTNKYRPVK